MKLVHGKRFVKEAITLIVMLAVSGVGVGMAHAQQGKPEGVKVTPSIADKSTNKSGDIKCWFDDNNNGRVDRDEIIWESPSTCSADGGENLGQ